MRERPLMGGWRMTGSAHPGADVAVKCVAKRFFFTASHVLAEARPEERLREQDALRHLQGREKGDREVLPVGRQPARGAHRHDHHHRHGHRGEAPARQGALHRAAKARSVGDHGAHRLPTGSFLRNACRVSLLFWLHLHFHRAHMVLPPLFLLCDTILFSPSP